jgi:ribosomal protein L18E
LLNYLKDSTYKKLCSILIHYFHIRAKTAVVVATVTDDIRTTGLDTPKMTIAALRFTETARAKIVKAGGKCLTLDQLIMATPTGKYWFFFLYLQ